MCMLHANTVQSYLIWVNIYLNVRDVRFESAQSVHSLQDAQRKRKKNRKNEYKPNDAHIYSL